MVDNTHLAVRCHSSFTISSRELSVRVNNEGVLSPGVRAQKVQKPEEAAEPRSCTHMGFFITSGHVA